MRKAFLTAVLFICLGYSWAQAQTDVLIEIDRGRTEGYFTKSPVYQRAILSPPANPSDTALLYFRGYPGIARIQSAGDKERNLIPFLRMEQKLLAEEGIALVVMDCPTDQWGAPGRHPTGCYDSYRKSTDHADDVRSVIAKLRNEYGYSKIFLMGHSLGTISSRWLAKNLGHEISGSIHSASINKPTPKGFATSFINFPYETIAAPVLHVHHEADACGSTLYAFVKDYAGENLVTVRGGLPKGDPCEGLHYHSYRGREEAVVRAIITWIKTKKIEKVVGE
jgi:poly(3-hydroxybutyrate) depolymerase